MSLPYLHPFLGLSNGLNTLHAAGGGGGIGGWVELGRTTLGSDTDTVSVGSLANKRYYMVLGLKIPNGSTDFNWRLGNSSVDTGSNYARRQSSNGGADTTNTSTETMFCDNGGATYPSFQVGFFSNVSNKEKLNISHSVGQNTAGAGNAPVRREATSKWANTSNALDVIAGVNIESGSMTSGSEVVVLGWDPADTHTNNFWQELASVELSSSASSISSGTITAKKYLWVQAYIKPVTSSVYGLIQFNSDTSGNYSTRFSTDGSADAIGGSQSYINSLNTLATTPFFINFFVVNNSANEKLAIFNTVSQLTAGAGTAPLRQEGVGKWANTSSQITSVQIDDGGGAGSFNTGSILKVYGSD